MSTKAMTLSRHILEQEEKHAEMRGELSALLAQIGLVARILARKMRRAALVGKLGLTGDQNPTGDSQKKLDVFANEVFVDAFMESGLVAAIVSEELDEVKDISCRDALKLHQNGEKRGGGVHFWLACLLSPIRVDLPSGTA